MLLRQATAAIKNRAPALNKSTIRCNQLQNNSRLKISSSSIGRHNISSSSSSSLLLLQNHGNILKQCAPAAFSSYSSRQYNHHSNCSYNHEWINQAVLLATAAASAAAALATTTTCTVTNNQTATTNDDNNFINSKNYCHCETTPTDLPTYTSAQIANFNGQHSPTNPNRRIWMSYGGNVYDVTEFIANHPGGSEKILMAAGGAIEPYWYLYRQHFASPLPQTLLTKMQIGYLHPTDQDQIDTQMEQVTEQTPDPYEHEPERNPALIVHGDTPMNAEVPVEEITKSYLTRNDLFYIRHHHPVPYLSEEEVEKFRLEVDLTLLFPEALKKKKLAANSGEEEDDEEEVLPMTTAVDIVRRETTDTSASTTCDNSIVAKLSLEQIKSLPKVELVSTLQCSGNRRGGFNDLRQTSGTPWSQGAISTAKWGGARLIDVLMLAMKEVSKDQDSSSTSTTTVTADKEANNNNGKENVQQQSSLIGALHSLQALIDDHPQLQHLRFESLDGLLASIDTNKGLNPFGDVIIAYEMNGDELPRDHGYPLRVIVPGYAAVRNVKWLKKLELAEEEALGTWQRGLNYKILPPTVLDAKEVDLNTMPGLSEECVFSGITHVENLSHTAPPPPPASTALEEEIFGSMSVPAIISNSRTPLTPGETVLVKTSGWAYAGGGRNIVRVDVTGNGGKSWQTARITEGSKQPLRRAWAWVFWECEVPAIVCEDGITVELACKGVDMAFNTQPESMGGMWNVRGLVNNSYYRVKHKVM